MSGIKAFQQAFVNSDVTDARAKFETFDARKTRYALLWAYYANSAYDTTAHPWAVSYLQSYGLYKYVRDIYNPAHRLAEFWVTALMGGLLDPNAGDGTRVRSALPILTPLLTQAQGDALRAAIAQLWRDSNWQTNKSIFTRYGVTLGDTALRVVDDAARARVYLETVHPALIKNVLLDPFGNVKAYEIEEMRADPRPGKSGAVKYNEIVVRGDDSNDAARPVLFKTLLDDSPYAWNGVAAEWTENYGFVPFVFVKHIDVGALFGWSELHSALSKLREVDNLASALDDQITKMVNAPWLFNFAEPRSAPSVANGQPTTEVPQPGKDKLPALYINNTDAKGQALVTDLNIEAVIANITKLLEQLEREYPELQADIWKLGGDASGRALRTAREPVEAKVMERRPHYDDAVRRALQMAISIGAQKGYAGFERFSETSFADGALDFTIGNRPVFRQDPLDDLEYEQAFWTAAAQAESAGYALELWLADRGWSEERIAKLLASDKFKAKRALLDAAVQGAQAGGGNFGG